MDKSITTKADDRLENTGGKSMPTPADGKTLNITPESKAFDFRAILGQVAQYVNMGEILAEIKAGTQYVVQIPAQYQAAYDSGELFFMHNQKSGQLWPSLMKIGENGKKKIVTPLPITEQAFLQGNPIQELANSHHNLMMQQQVAQLATMVENTYRAVERIEHGQMDDRIGMLEAGKKGLTLAMALPEGEERTQQITASRTNILIAHEQIGKTLQRRVNEFKPLPQSDIARFWRELLHSGYLAKKQHEVEEIQEYYDLYLQSTKLLAASFAICGHIDAADNAFQLSEQFVRTINFGKVKTISYQHKKLNNMFYSSPVDFIARERTICMEEAKNYDYVAIEVDGETLMEVLENGQAEAVSEADVG